LSAGVWLGSAALGAWLIWLQPSLRASKTEPALRQRAGSESAARLALGGGVVTLRSPASLMIRVAGGKFTMGSSDDEVLDATNSCKLEPLGHKCDVGLFANELPLHQVSIKSFFLDRTEVTVAEYRRCVDRGRCEAPRFAEGAARFKRDDYPVTLVSWAEARAYCRFRGARLPSEAEYERAARGPGARSYPWGNLYNSRAANHGRLGLDQTDASDGYAELAPVGSFSAGRTPEGFLDLSGNVAEWVEDIYTFDYSGKVPDPNQPIARTVRGGNYLDAAPWLRGAARKPQHPDARAPFIGFRCARAAGTVGMADDPR
jgi:formylglycine-generating enzyme required for sulfatase activity